MNRLVARLRRQVLARAAGEHPDSGVALFAALMTIMILTAMSVVVLGIVLSQVTTTHFAQKNTRTIYAAEAGVETALGKIRTAAGSVDITGQDVRRPAPAPVHPDRRRRLVHVGHDVRRHHPVLHGGPGGQVGRLACLDTLPGRLFSRYRCRDAAHLRLHRVARPGRVLGPRGQRTRRTAASRWCTSSRRRRPTSRAVASGPGRAPRPTPSSASRRTASPPASFVTYKAVSDCQSSANESTQFWVYDTDYTLKLAVTAPTTTPLCITVPRPGLGQR